MFSYILKIRTAATAQTDELFERFTRTPGLLSAYDLQGADDPEDAVVVTIWENREAAEAYLEKSPLRKEVDVNFPDVTRTMYEVRNSK